MLTRQVVFTKYTLISTVEAKLVNITCILLNCGRNLECLEKIHLCMCTTFILYSRTCSETALYLSFNRFNSYLYSNISL